ncbi:MAG: hypothetical protein VB835_11370, partial [Pirellulales bacterium]
MPSIFNQASSPLRRFVVVLVTALAVVATPVAPARAEDAAAASLTLVPKDAAFYTSSMRLAEQI